MALRSGTNLGPYEILSPLGSGGMGDVYRARDPRLGRDVAVKVISESFASDPGRLHRFEQEARAVAAMNHPNILSVHDIGQHNDIHYIVTELLDGSTLREKLNGGPLAPRRATEYAAQVAQGLAAAHDKGVVHRDLKPENLFITKDGRIKILDFGLAKLRQTRTDGIGPTQSLGTDPGMVMGTAGYMSPEQVRGQTVDHRTDIFAFGAILYELLTGKRAFQRSTSAETMTAILNDDPPAISQTGANIPSGLQRVANRCLEKDPEHRFHSASDLAFALDALSDSGSSPALVAKTSRSPRRTLALATAFIALISLAAVGWFEITRNAAVPLRISEYTQLTHNGHAGYVIGTDGSRLYLIHFINPSIEQVAVSGGEIETVSSIKLPNASLSDVSPDGSTLLVESGGAATPATPLNTVQVVGGAHRYLADATSFSGTWSPDGKLVAYATPNGDLNVVNSDGTDAHKVGVVGDDANLLRWSPDGNTIRLSRNLESLWETTSTGSNLHQLLPRWHPLEDKCCGRWLPSGEFFAFLVGPLGPTKVPQAQIYALDERRGLFRRPAKDPIRLTSGPMEWSLPVFSNDGKKIFATGSTRRGELVRLDAQSNQFQPFLGGISADLIAFSKDGEFVAYVSYPDGILWRANRDGSDRVQLTSPSLSPKSLPAWSPDGTQLVFEASSPQGPHVWIVPSRGGSPQRLLPEDGGPETQPSWSPDGRKITFSTGEIGERESHIRILDLATRQISTLPGSDGKFVPRWSPDGQFINAASIDGATLYVFDTKTQHWSALNTGPHAFALWSSDSRSIYFLRWAADPAILRIPATGGEAKLVVSLNFAYAGTIGLWFGLDPTDAPLMLRDASTTDVYSMTLEEK